MDIKYPWLKPYLERFKQGSNAISNANNSTPNAIPQSLLIAGVKGLGKSVLARSLCTTLLCQTQSGCGTCKSCHWFLQGNHPDFHLIEPEKKLISVDKIREVSHFVATTPQYGAKKVILVLSAELMNTAASNALLKMLEEPNAYLHWVLVSDHFDRLSVTILSRVQRLIVNSPPVRDALDYVMTIANNREAKAKVEEAVLLSLLNRSSGAPLAALQLLEHDITQDVLGPLLSMQPVAQIADKWATFEPSEVLELLLHFLRDAKILQISPTPFTGLQLPHFQSEISLFAQTRNPKILGALWDKVTQMRAKVVRERGFNASLLYCDLLADWTAS